MLYFWHRVGNRFLTLLSNMFTNLNLTDMETCYKVFRREVIQAIEIEENRFGFEPEITAKVAKSRCRIFEVGISYYGRTYEEGKKIGWRDGLPRALVHPQIQSLPMTGSRWPPTPPNGPERMSEAGLASAERVATRRAAPWWADSLVALLFLALGMGLILRPYATGGTMPGNLGDGRFNLAVLEFFYRTLARGAAWPSGQLR